MTFKLRERIEPRVRHSACPRGWKLARMWQITNPSRPKARCLCIRVMPEFDGDEHIVVLNDEAHHCYRKRVLIRKATRSMDLKGDEEAAEAKEAS